MHFNVESVRHLVVLSIFKKKRKGIKIRDKNDTRLTACVKSSKLSNNRKLSLPWRSVVGFQSSPRPVSHIPTWGCWNGKREKEKRVKKSICCCRVQSVKTCCWAQTRALKGWKTEREKLYFIYIYFFFPYLWYCAWRNENSSLIRSHDSLMVNLNGCPGCGGP